MAGEIGKAGLILTVNGVEFEAKLKSAGDKVTDFSKKVQKASLRDYAEGVGKVREAFASLNQLDLSNPISALQNLKSQLELVVLSAKSAKVALMTLGVGAALAIGGSILSSFFAREDAPAAGSDAERLAEGRRLAGLPERRRTGLPGLLAHLPIGEGARRAAEAAEIERDHRARIALAHSEVAGSIAARRGPMEARAAVARIDPRSGDPRMLHELSEASERAVRMDRAGSRWDAHLLRREIAETTSTMRVTESAERTRGLLDLARGTRDDASRIGMGPEAAALADLDRGDTERVERHTSRMRELERAYSSGTLTMREHARMVAEHASAFSAEEAAARAAHEAIRERGRAALAESLRSPLELASRRISEIRALGASGEITDRSIGSLLMGLGSGPEVGRNAPSALMMGTAAAVDAANRIARDTAAASADPVERVRMAIEHLTTIADDERRATEEVGRALREGRIVLPAGRR